MSVKILYVPFRASKFAENEFVRGWVTNKLGSDKEYPLRGRTRATGVYKKGKDKGKNAHLYVYYWGDKFVDLLDDEDWIHDNNTKLYVVGHTNRGLHSLYKSPNFGWRDLVILKRFRPDRVVSYTTLCDRLIDAGLVQAFAGKLIIYGCSSARRGELFEKSFAQKFARTLRAKGFRQCRIFGYTREVSTGYSKFEGPEHQGEYHRGAVRQTKTKQAGTNAWKSRAHDVRKEIGAPDVVETYDAAYTADEYADGEDELSRISGDASAISTDVDDAMALAELDEAAEGDSTGED
jgi:hypothetical protein